jgi:hypothetical protein
LKSYRLFKLKNYNYFLRRFWEDDSIWNTYFLTISILICLPILNQATVGFGKLLNAIEFWKSLGRRDSVGPFPKWAMLGSEKSNSETFEVEVALHECQAKPQSCVFSKHLKSVSFMWSIWLTTTKPKEWYVVSWIFPISEDMETERGVGSFSLLLRESVSLIFHSSPGR